MNAAAALLEISVYTSSRLTYSVVSNLHTSLSPLRRHLVSAHHDKEPVLTAAECYYAKFDKIIVLEIAVYTHLTTFTNFTRRTRFISTMK